MSLLWNKQSKKKHLPNSHKGMYVTYNCEKFITGCLYQVILVEGIGLIENFGCQSDKAT